MTTREKMKKVINRTKLQNLFWLWDNGKKSEFDVLFDHKFAKAFFGEKEVNLNGETHNYWRRIDSFGWESCGLKGWEFHLREAVISENPLDYYYKNYYYENL